MRKNKDKKEDQKWEILGFTDKHHYRGWLHFNDLVDESYVYDNIYFNEYTGETEFVFNGIEDEESEEYIDNLLISDQGE